MHGCSLGSAFLVNAEVDSMGGVVDGGVSIDTKTSPRRAAIEKAQTELRQEYDVREERRRELEFLEKGGNPLDFKFGHAASVSVQSTSLTDHHPEQIATSEATGSFALTASPHGDSVESSGPTVCEPNSADNLLLFDGENELLEGERNSMHPRSRSNIAEGSQYVKESEDSAIFRPYARRNRSRPNRDGARSSSTDMIPSRGVHGSSFPAGHGSRDAKGLVSERNNQKDQNTSFSNPTFAKVNGNMVPQVVTSDNQVDMELDGVQALETSTGLAKDLPDGSLDVEVPRNLQDNQHNRSSQVDTQQIRMDKAAAGPDIVGTKDLVVSASVECPPCAATEKTGVETSSGQTNGFSSLRRDRHSIREGQSSCPAFSIKGLDSESSCTQTNFSVDGNNDSDLCTNPGNINSNGNPKEHVLAFEGTPNIAGEEMVKETNVTKPIDGGVITNDHNPVHQSNIGNGPLVKVEDEIHRTRTGLENEVKYSTNIEGLELNDHAVSNADREVGNMLGDNINPNRESSCPVRPQGITESSIRGLSEATNAPELQTCSSDHLKVANKAHEDSILEEARIIEAKRKRIAELSVSTLPLENRRKSHWEFVLEEMTWLANDFIQERLWKIAAAAQISHQVAFASRLRFEKQYSHRKQRKLAYTMAKAVMQFWHSAKMLINSEDPEAGLKKCEYDLTGSRRVDGNEVAGEPNTGTSKELEPQHPEKSLAFDVKGYAVRFLKYNNSIVSSVQVEAPGTPDKITDLGIQNMLCEDHFTEERLFYTVSPGTTDAYRKSIESYLVQCEKIGNSMQEEVETSMHDAGEESQENAYDEDEGETSTYYLPGAFEGSKSSKCAQKKRKNIMKSYSARSYDMGADLPYGNCTAVSQQSVLLGKRPANNLNVGSIPTKRVRTASRQRVLSPFSAGATGVLQPPNKTEALSGDTNSFQDDQSTLHGGSQIQRSLEVESVDFENHLPFDSAEISTRTKKKKKPKHLNSTYEQRWQFDSSAHNDQRDHSRKRLDGHHFDSNGGSGLFGQHNAKKPKIMKQSLDSPFDNMTPMTGSIPSPAASQMSNMSNPNKFMKMIGGRDRGRKSKALKMPAGQPGCGSPWSLFEDQALVVLVHDMGPNWELVSDAINSTLQFKCIFRKPKECKERHNILMDRNAGDGADSAEDSGSSQPYPSTLPGIPKGSARQLFQRLQGPMEEGTIKSHFEKIITIGQRQHYRRTQSDNQDLKQIATVHNSHVIALSQVCPNNLNGGFLTPLDLCDAVASSPDVQPPGYQGPHTSGLAISNQGTVAPILPSSGANSSLQVSPGMVLGGNLSSPSGPLSASVRDGRYGVPRTSLPDEQQRLQQYNPMLPGRNIQQPSLPVPGALPGTDRGVRLLPGGNGMGMMCGMNRGMPLSRPGFQGIASSSMLNSGSMLSSSMVGMPSPVNMHPGAPSGQGNSMSRPREALHMMRPGQNLEHQRQMMVPELQMQVTQGNSQGVVPPFNGLNPNFSNQSAPPGQTYSVHPQTQHQMPPQPSHVLNNPHHSHLQGPSHPTNSQHPYARLVKQQRMMQQPQFSPSNSLMPHVQPQSQLPVSSNNSQIQPQNPQQVQPSSPMNPMPSQFQQKHQMPPHGLNRNTQPGPSGLANPMGKRPRPQQFQQSGRHHPAQRQQSQSQQQAKLMKGMGRGNMMLHQNLSIDPSHLNGLSMTPPGSQVNEKGEQVMHLMQGQGGLYSGPGLNHVQPSRPLVPPQSSNQSQMQPKPFSGPAPGPPPLKQVQQMPPSDNSNVSSVPVMAPNQQKLPLQPQQKQMNHTQPNVQRILQQNRQMNSDLPNKSQPDQAQADQQPPNSQMGTSTSSTGMSQPFESSNPTQVASSSSTPQRKASEPLYDPKSGSDSKPPPVSLHRQLSGGLPNTIGEQWPQQQKPVPPAPPSPSPSSSPSPSPQQVQQLEENQEENVQAGQSSLYTRPPNSRLE